MLGKLAGVFVVGIMKGSQPAVAADTAAGTTIYNTGKAPIVPGQKPKDKGDVSGYVHTAKVMFFLRIMKQHKITAYDSYSYVQSYFLSHNYFDSFRTVTLTIIDIQDEEGPKLFESPFRLQGM
jgi:hypothetical protein